jgi:hypothetical protein
MLVAMIEVSTWWPQQRQAESRQVHGIKERIGEERRGEECTVKLLNVFVFRSASVAMLLCLFPSEFTLLACTVEFHHLGFQHLMISHFGIIVVSFTLGCDKSQLTIWLASQLSPLSWLILFLYQFFTVSWMTTSYSGMFLWFWCLIHLASFLICAIIRVLEL